MNHTVHYVANFSIVFGTLAVFFYALEKTRNVRTRMIEILETFRRNLRKCQTANPTPFESEKVYYHLYNQSEQGKSFGAEGFLFYIQV
jgi:hypothetical protein